MLRIVGERSPSQYEGEGGVGCLLLPDLSGARARMSSVGERLIRAGCAVEMPHIPWMETDRWPIWLDAARSHYTALRARTGGVIVVGCGAGCVLALLLAQRYSLDALVCLRLPKRPGGFPTAARARSLRALHRRARRDLYAVAAPTLIIQPTAEAHRARRLQDALRAPCTLRLADGNLCDVAADAIIERARHINSPVSHGS